MNRSLKTVLCVLLPLLVALVSCFRLAGPMSAPETHRDTIAYLEERRLVVLDLTGASTAASVAITLIPGDAGTPIAEKLADLSSAFLVILTALVLEKYMVTLSAYVVFRFLIPLACVLLSLFWLLRHEALLHAALRLLAFCLALFWLIPVSVRLSTLIEQTYQDLQVAVTSALAEEEQMDLLADASASSDVDPEASASASAALSPAEQSSVEERRSWLQKAMDELTGRAGQAGAAVQARIERIKEDVAEIANEVTVAPEKLSRLMNHYIEVVSVLIVTSCVIPVLVFFVFYWLIRLCFRLELPSLDQLFREARRR